jgi:hypothetical protein
MWSALLINAGDYDQVDTGDGGWTTKNLVKNGTSQAARTEDIHKSWAGAHLNGG